MKLTAAVVKEQGVTFAVVVVKRHVLDSPTQRSDAQRSFAPLFPGAPVVLMVQDHRGVPTYWGRRDIVKFLGNVPMEALPWREYRLN
jgi:hypothetical protein